MPLLAEPASAPPPVVVLARRQSPREALARVADELAAVERDRLALVAERDALVARLHTDGVSWGELATLAGTSRQALMKRG